MNARRGIAVALLGTAVLAGAGHTGAAGQAQKPRLDLRATPRSAFPPASVLVAAQLKGGEDLEDFYCPGLEWDWGDGSRSVHEADCPPFDAGVSLERFFSARHAYRQSGGYTVRLTLRRADRVVAAASIPVLIHGPDVEPGEN